MKISEGMRKNGVSVDADCTLREAAGLMERHVVGALAVLEDDRVVGIVTDRDLVRRAVAAGVAPDARVDSVMSTPVVTIDADAELRDAFALFGEHAIRRIVVESSGRFVGIISADDLVVDLASDLAAVSRPIAAQVLFGHRDSAVPAST